MERRVTTLPTGGSLVRAAGKLQSTKGNQLLITQSRAGPFPRKEQMGIKPDTVLGLARFNSQESQTCASPASSL
jgi:hypothetical protein